MTELRNGRPNFWDLVEEHQTALWRFALALTRSRDDAKDLVSDTVLAAFRAYPKLRDRTAFRKSLFTICVRIYKRQKWRRRIFAASSVIESMDSREERTRESQYDVDQLMTALNRLPQKQRETLVLFELSGFSIEEICKLQGGSISGVKTRLVRGREVLKAMLTETDQKATVA